MARGYVRYADGTCLPTTEEGKAIFLKELEREACDQLEALQDFLAALRRQGLRPGDTSLAELDALASELGSLDPRLGVDELLGIGSMPPAWWPKGECWEGDD
jgi:hypothetical protein